MVHTVLCWLTSAPLCPVCSNIFARTLTEGGKSQPIKPTPGLPGAQAGAAGGLLAIVATVGGILFVCNLCLLYCYVKRRAGKQLHGEPTDLSLLLRLATTWGATHDDPVGAGGARGVARHHHRHRRHRRRPLALPQRRPPLLLCPQPQGRAGHGHIVRGWVVERPLLLTPPLLLILTNTNTNTLPLLLNFLQYRIVLRLITSV